MERSCLSDAEGSEKKKSQRGSRRGGGERKGEKEIEREIERARYKYGGRMIDKTHMCVRYSHAAYVATCVAA